MCSSLPGSWRPRIVGKSLSRHPCVQVGASDPELTNLGAFAWSSALSSRATGVAAEPMASVCGCIPAPDAPSFRPVVVRAAPASPAEPVPVLPAPSRLRTPGDFRDTQRQGVRCGRPSLVLHARRVDDFPSRAGFIVSKAVGNAVERNRVKRRLRHLAAAALSGAPFAVDVVVRALPSATSGDLPGDFGSALGSCLERLSA